MADNVTVKPQTESGVAPEVVLAFDDVSGVLVPRAKIGFGVDGAYSDVHSGNPLPVTGALTDNQLRATPVEVSFTWAGLTDTQLRASPVPVALDAASLAALENITVGGTVAVSNFPASQAVTGPLTDAQLRADAVPVSGTFWQATQPISADSLPLPAGAATQVTLANIDAEIQLIESYFKTEDAPAISGEKGLPLLAMRQIADTTSTDTDGDYTLIKIDEEGRVKVATKPASFTLVTGNITANSQTVFCDVSRASNVMIAMVATSLVGHNVTFEGSIDSTNGTNGNWFGIQVIRSNANTIELTSGVLAATPAYAWEASVNGLAFIRVRATAHTSGTATWNFQRGSYATEPIPAAQISGTQPVSGTVTATVTAGTVNPVVPATPYILNSAASTNGALILTGTSGLQAFFATNTGAGAAYVKLYNKATAPVVGTDVPAMILVVPAAVSGVPGVCTLPIGFSGFRFALGLGIAITGGAADTDTTAVAAGQVKVALSRTV